jgi:hypothetical protein
MTAVVVGIETEGFLLRLPHRPTRSRNGFETNELKYPNFNSICCRRPKHGQCNGASERLILDVILLRFLKGETDVVKEAIVPTGVVNQLQNYVTSPLK